ncbi:MAG: DUF4892 domain-containing protein [Gammaproteobacteria bacterium]|nr:DUF4892 domain-containing protein [Gammaproteobacteria bacterium]
MFQRFCGLIALILLALAGVTAAKQDESGDIDPPMAARFPESVLIDHARNDHGEYRFVTEVSDTGGEIGGRVVRGEVTRYLYRQPEATPIFLIHGHYRKALKDAGAEVVFHCSNEACGPAELAEKWRRVTGLRSKSGDDCEYIAARLEGEHTRSWIALMIGSELTEIDVIEQAKDKPQESKSAAPPAAAN